MIDLTQDEEAIWKAILPDCAPTKIDTLLAALPVQNTRPPKTTIDVYTSDHIVTLTWRAAISQASEYYVHLHVDENGVTIGNCHVPAQRPKRQGFGRAVLAVAASLAGGCVTRLLEADATSEGLPAWLKLGAQLQPAFAQRVGQTLQREEPALAADQRLIDGDWGAVLQDAQVSNRLEQVLLAVKGERLAPVYWDEPRLSCVLQTLKR